MTLGDRLKVWRARKGWGLRELARHSGVDVSLISRLESGERQTISLDAAMKLARALGISLDYLSGMYEESVSLDYLVGFTDDPRPHWHRQEML